MARNIDTGGTWKIGAHRDQVLWNEDEKNSITAWILESSVSFVRRWRTAASRRAANSRKWGSLAPAAIEIPVMLLSMVLFETRIRAPRHRRGQPGIVEQNQHTPVS
jgi:hypothetical protein